MLVVVGVLNFSQRVVNKLPATDGVTWKTTKDGIFADKIEPNSAAEKAYLVKGDKLLGISLDSKKFDESVSQADIQVYLEEAGVGGRLTYLLQRTSYSFSDNFYYADLINLDAPPRWTASYLSLVLVGLICLFIGFFVLFNQGGRVPYVLHFATLCLIGFVFLFFRPIGTFEKLDLAIAIIDDVAFILFSPIFFHFCLIYPVRSKLFNKVWLSVLLYVPSIILASTSIFTYLYDSLIISDGTTERISKYLDNSSFLGSFYQVLLWHFIAGLSFGAGVLVYRFVRNGQTVIRQRLKWMMAGTIAAVVPTIAYQLARNSFDLPTENWFTILAILPLALIPLTFGHSVVRYRLMDVDIVVRRAAVYALTTLAISTLIGAIAFGFVFVVNEEDFTIERVAQFAVVVIAMGAIILLTAPLKNFLQERADRFFYGERYDLRHGLLDFGKTLSASIELDSLLKDLVQRFQQVLNVEKVAVFLEDERAVSGYRLAHSVNLNQPFQLAPDFRQMIRQNSSQNGVVRIDGLDLPEDLTAKAVVKREIHYFVPCVARGKMVAVIGFGRANDGSLLSSEDLEILQTVSGYVAVAIENSLLYAEQQRRAEEVTLLKEFNESIVESVNVALLAVDGEGIITSCNTTAEDLFGVTREDAIGEHIEELFALDFGETLTRVLGKTRWHLNEVRNAYKLNAKTRDGVSFVLNLAVAPLRSSSSGEQKGAILVLEDITARISLESQLQQREKLSSIGLLAAGVAHEVNTPLTGVSSYTQMLLGMIPETDPKHLLLEKVKKQTDRASNIVGNLLNFSRSGNAGEFVEVSLEKILDDTIQLLEIQLRSYQVRLVKNYQTDLPFVFGNAGKLQQVFTNLILNARDAIGDVGKIEITTEANGDEITVSISDDGIGIAPENLSKIYDPFFTTKDVGEGTGLGLAVSYGIIQEHAGQVNVESAAGEGTTFRLKFPIAHAKRLQAVGD